MKMLIYSSASSSGNDEQQFSDILEVYYNQRIEFEDGGNTSKPLKKLEKKDFLSN